MALIQTPVKTTKKYYIQENTQNRSFVNMHVILKSKGIKNNAFFLAVLDPVLLRVNPRDENINYDLKQRILRECTYNYWYFLREVLRIPEQGGSANSGKMYELHRGNLALNFCLINNWNVFCELPRQHGKTIAVICRILWEFLFGTRNSEMAFINKKYEDSKLNLARMKDIRRALPTYLQMVVEQIDAATGKKIRTKDSVEALENPINRNKIVTVSSANSKIKANTLGRGCTQPRQWYDEFAFIPYNKIVYLSATPAFKTAAENARNNGAPYGIAITTTPGDLTTEEGAYAYRMTELATKFNEMWYDLPLVELQDILNRNENSKFIHIRFSYQQLGRSEDWFKDICLEMQKNWDEIRREVLLEWSEAAGDSPFSKNDLALVESLCMKEPLDVCKIGHFSVNIYKKATNNIELLKDMYIMGVDVSGGLSRDSSTFTVINARTTEVVADFNCNYINQHEFAMVIYTYVSKYLPNCVINIERNGGFGQAVLADLKQSNIKNKLFFEYKEKVIEERMNGVLQDKRKAVVKNFGFDNTGNSRERLMEILRIRMNNHKGKFISPILARELKTLTRTKRGKIEHTPTGHDDQIMSYLLALYVWYEGGTHLEENWGLKLGSIRTDEDVYEETIQFNDGYNDISMEIEHYLEPNDQVQQSIDWLNKGKGKTYKEWMDEERKKDDECMQRILETKGGRQAYAKEFGMTDLEMENISRQAQSQGFKIPDKVFTGFYGDDEY